MSLKVEHQDSDANNINDYFDALRQKNYEASFDDVKNFIAENKDRLYHRRHKKLLRKWQWALVVLFPVLVVLACTKTEHSEPVGRTVTFTLPESDDAARQTLEAIVGGLETVVLQDKQKPGYLSYICFIPAQNGRSADAIVNQLKGIKGVAGLTTAAVNARVKESLLSQLGNKIFSTHIDANAQRDDEVQNELMRQLKEKGFDNISVTVTRDKKGIRILELHPGKGGPNYLIDVSADDKGTKMMLQEENGTTPEKINVTRPPQPDFSSMTDAQVRAYIRRQHGKQLRDAAIKITRTADEIAIDIKQGDKKDEIIRFKLH